jgi:hypothetical protein
VSSSAGYIDQKRSDLSAAGVIINVGSYINVIYKEFEERVARRIVPRNFLRRLEEQTPLRQIEESENQKTAREFEAIRVPC